LDDFIAIDFETGNCSPASAISVGLVRYRDFREAESFYSLIRPPELYILPDFTRIHGLTVADVRDAPDFREVWESGLRDFIGELPLVAHNASFDMKVLGSTLAHHGIGLRGQRYFCSLALARKVWPELPSRSLPALGSEFGIRYEAHNALADARTCGKVVLLGLRAVADRKGPDAGIALEETLREAKVWMKTLDA